MLFSIRRSLLHITFFTAFSLATVTTVTSTSKLTTTTATSSGITPKCSNDAVLSIFELYSALAVPFCFNFTRTGTPSSTAPWLPKSYIVSDISSACTCLSKFTFSSCATTLTVTTTSIAKATTVTSVSVTTSTSTLNVTTTTTKISTSVTTTTSTFTQLVPITVTSTINTTITFIPPAATYNPGFFTLGFCSDNFNFVTTQLITYPEDSPNYLLVDNDPDYAHTGVAYSVIYLPFGYNVALVHSPVTVNPNTAYTFTVWIDHNAGTDGSVCQANLYATSGDDQFSTTTFTLPPAYEYVEWLQYTASIYTSNFTQVVVGIQFTCDGEDGAANDINIDDVAFF